MRLSYDWYDRDMIWSCGVNLRHWLFGFSFDGSSFYISFGPFYCGRSDVPF